MKQKNTPFKSTEYFKFTYEGCSVDRWTFWQNAKPWNRIMKKSHEHCEHPSFCFAEHFSQLLSEAIEKAIRLGWEGDGKFRFTVLPRWFDEPYFIFAVKQNNNGWTYVFSPVNLDWMEEEKP